MILVDDYIETTFCLAKLDKNGDESFQNIIVKPLKKSFPSLCDKTVVSFDGEACLSEHVRLDGNDYIIYNRAFHNRLNIASIIVGSDEILDGLPELGFCCNIIARNCLSMSELSCARALTQAYEDTCKKVRSVRESGYGIDKLDSMTTLAAIGFVLNHEACHIKLANDSELKTRIISSTKSTIASMLSPTLYKQLDKLLLDLRIADGFFEFAGEDDIQSMIDGAKEFATSSEGFVEELTCDSFALVSIIRLCNEFDWMTLEKAISACLLALDFGYMESICLNASKKLVGRENISLRTVIMNFLVRRAYLDEVINQYGYQDLVKTKLLRRFEERVIHRAFSFVRLQTSQVAGWNEALPSRGLVHIADPAEISALSERLAFRHIMGHSDDFVSV